MGCGKGRQDREGDTRGFNPSDQLSQCYMVLCILAEKKINHQFYPTVSPVSYNNNLLDEIHPPVQYWHDSNGSNQALSDWCSRPHSQDGSILGIIIRTSNLWVDSPQRRNDHAFRWTQYLTNSWWLIILPVDLCISQTSPEKLLSAVDGN